VALALYRKYRSATFAEVIGQEHVTVPLMQALGAGRINHAYLFSGPRGCGKTSSARILARSLNCEKGPTPTPCGECGSCKDLAPNGAGSIDVIEIDAASHGGVDDARDLRERAYYAPVRDRYKVYIIDEAHMVTTQGFNALLKLVEEPPEFLIFIFATTEPDKVLQTIRSRTHHYPFRLIPPSALRAHLERICQAEGATVEPTVFPLVVRSGGGSARDSLSILDQLLAGAGPEGVTYSMAVGLLGVTDGALLDDMTDSLAVGDSAAVYATIDRVVEAGHDPRRFAADLLDRFRDLIMIDAVPEAVEKGLIDYPADQAERMADQSRRIGSASLVRFADITHTTLTDMRGTTSPRLMLELLCARMLLPDASTESSAMLQRLERLERRQGMATAPSIAPDEPPTGPEKAPVVAKAPERVPETKPAARPAAQPEPTPQPAPAPVPPVAAAGADSVGLRNHWPAILEQVKSRSRRTRALLDNASIASVEGTTIRLAATSAPIAKMIADDSNLSVLREALSSVVGGGWQIDIGADAGSAPTLTPATPATPSTPAPQPRPTRSESDGVDEESDAVEASGRDGGDPEAAAISLLQNSLGARPIEG
jgi:DNA polymerase-3 subunit gamma/tau